jgi:hypothetical protein
MSRFGPAMREYAGSTSSKTAGICRFFSLYRKESTQSRVFEQAGGAFSGDPHLLRQKPK